MKDVTIFTDGACTGNPGPGGYGVVLIYGEHRKELSGGFKLTTNNRMELLACIKGLEALKYKCNVTLMSDSKYIVDGITKGWAEKWRRFNWIKYDKQKAKNPDLWERLLDLCNFHTVKFVWVKGHAGNAENERCDLLAREAILQNNLPKDEEYLKSYHNDTFGDKDF